MTAIRRMNLEDGGKESLLGSALVSLRHLMTPRGYVFSDVICSFYLYKTLFD